jgi:hypothetical protein
VVILRFGWLEISQKCQLEVVMCWIVDNHYCESKASVIYHYYCCDQETSQNGVSKTNVIVVLEQQDTTSSVPCGLERKIT